MRSQSSDGMGWDGTGQERKNLKGSEKKSQRCVSWTSIKNVRKVAKRLGDVGSRRDGKSRKGKEEVKEVKVQ